MSRCLAGRVALCCGALLAVGCQPSSTEMRLVPAKTLVRKGEARVKSIEALPDRLRKQIGQALETYFGTATEPRMFEPAKGSAEMDAAAAPDGAEKDAPKLVAQTKPDVLKHGHAVFMQRCAACHGATGNGEGPVAAYMNPRPRDYRLGIFKFTSTPFGSKPRRTDIARTVVRGAKGTSMPAFALLEDGDLQAVVDYVIMLSQRGEVEQRLIVSGEALDPENPEDNFLPADIATEVTTVADSWRAAQYQQIIPLTPEPPYNDESVAKGQALFQDTNFECSKCHGLDGRGRMPQPVGKDAWTGDDVYAADLSSGMLHGGRRPIDIYRRIYSGINGTPMPSFAVKFKDNPEAIWHLVHFINSVTEGRQFAASPPMATPPQASSSAAAAAR